MTPLGLAALAGHAALAVATLESARRRDAGALVNAGGALLLSVLPWLVGLTLAEPLDPVLPLWLAVAGLLHAAGMLGLYESLFWWDHLTHGLSSALVAALALAGLVVGGRAGTAPALSPTARAVAVLGLALAVGVFWELLEVAARRVGDALGVEPLLVYYGRWDTPIDLLFNLTGALVVVVLDLRVLVPVAERAPRAAGWLTTVASGGVVAGTAVLAVVLWLVGGEWLPSD